MNTLAKCKCQHCNQNIEFDSSRANETVACPGCGMDTMLFIPVMGFAAPKTPEPEYSVDKKNVAVILIIIGLLSLIGFIVVLVDPEQSEINPAVFLLLSICGGILYFIPSLVGSRKRQFPAILALNLLLGWTLIGWAGALVWALIKEKRES